MKRTKSTIADFSKKNIISELIDTGVSVKEAAKAMQKTMNIIKLNVKILALDQASKLGWALSRESYGIWDLTTRKDESIGMKLLRFEAKLIEIIELAKINLVVYERVAGRFKSALIHAAKLVAIIESTCEKKGINYRAYSAQEIKKFATGKGNCGKPAMIKAAQDKLGYKGNDDNEADALWILELAISEYK